MMVTPAACRVRTTSHMPLRSSTSTPAVGSSRNRICGSCDSALAIMTRRFMPPDSVRIAESFLSHSDRSFSTFSIWAGFFGLPNRPRLNLVVVEVDVLECLEAGAIGLRQIGDGDDGGHAKWWLGRKAGAVRGGALRQDKGRVLEIGSGTDFRNCPIGQLFLFLRRFFGSRC